MKGGIVTFDPADSGGLRDGRAGAALLGADVLGRFKNRVGPLGPSPRSAGFSSLVQADRAGTNRLEHGVG